MFGCKPAKYSWLVVNNNVASIMKNSRTACEGEVVSIPDKLSHVWKNVLNVTICKKRDQDCQQGFPCCIGSHIVLSFSGGHFGCHFLAFHGNNVGIGLFSSFDTFYKMLTAHTCIGHHNKGMFT